VEAPSAGRLFVLGTNCKFPVGSSGAMAKVPRLVIVTVTVFETVSTTPPIHC